MIVIQSRIWGTFAMDSLRNWDLRVSMIAKLRFTRFHEKSIIIYFMSYFVIFVCSLCICKINNITVEKKIHEIEKKGEIFQVEMSLKKFSRTPRLCCNVKHSSDLTPYRTLWFAEEVVIFQLCVSLLWNLNLWLFRARKCIWYPFFRWHSDKPYRTRLRLVRYGLSECHLNPYRTRMDTICISSSSRNFKKMLHLMGDGHYNTTELQMTPPRLCDIIHVTNSVNLKIIQVHLLLSHPRYIHGAK